MIMWYVLEHLAYFFIGVPYSRNHQGRLLEIDMRVDHALAGVEEVKYI
jgi:hypothetical protein